ncbi:MAG: hypothetical protein AB1Z23_06895 [Eubacteriales bacterium]
MKTKTIVIIILIGLALFASRNYIKDFVGPIFDGNDETTSFTEEQQSALDDFKNGVSNVFSLFKDNLFSLDELGDADVVDDEKPLKSIGEMIDNDDSFSITDISISSLNLENLNNEQIAMLAKALTGEITMTELLTSGKFTFKDLQDMGLFEVIMDNLKKKD